MATKVSAGALEFARKLDQAPSRFSSAAITSEKGGGVKIAARIEQRKRLGKVNAGKSDEN